MISRPKKYIQDPPELKKALNLTRSVHPPTVPIIKIPLPPLYYNNN